MHTSPAELTLTPGGQRMTHLPLIEWGGVPEFDAVLEGDADGVFHDAFVSAFNDSSQCMIQAKISSSMMMIKMRMTKTKN